jgi:CheY-like chemotaxis protein
LKTRPRTPERILSVDLVAADPLLAARLSSFGRRAAGLRLQFSEAALPDCDAYVFPAGRLPPPAALEALRAMGAVLLAHGPAGRLRGAFLAGCDDFLREPWSPEELECRLERACRERRGAKAPAAGFAWGELRLEGLRARSPFGQASLSLPESRILTVLMARRGEALGRQVLAYAVWGRPARAGSRALDVHVAGLRRKLRALLPPGRPAREPGKPARGPGALIRALRGAGYVLD